VPIRKSKYGGNYQLINIPKAGILCEKKIIVITNEERFTRREQ